MKETASQIIASHASEGSALRLTFFAEQESNILRTSKIMAQALKSGHKILICGNGGSAADAQHFSAELTGRFLAERRSLPGIALSTDTSALTAIANDYGAESMFSRQVEGLGQKGDILVAISTSGNSPNILRALEAARSKGLVCVGITGRNGGKMPPLCDEIFVVPSQATPLIQETHITLIHLFCRLIDFHLFEQTGQ